MPHASETVSPDSVYSAARRIHGAILNTPFQLSRTLSDLVGARVWLKFENHQFTASFKERGALNKLLTLTDQERRQGVIAMSAGNHAQGVAYHCQRLGIPATIIMPRYTPLNKVRHTRAFGATVELAGSNVDESYAVARQRMESENLVFVHPYDDPEVIAGQGTIALEMLQQEPDLDMLVVPIGGGGLISGISVAARSLNPDIEILGVQSEVYPFAFNRFYSSNLEPRGAATIAEGIAVKSPGQLTMEIIKRNVSDVLLASEAEIEKAVALLASVEKTVAEGAGAAALGALLHSDYSHRFTNKKIGIIICGGNIDERILAFVMLRSLARDGRLIRMRVESTDVPGELARISEIIARHEGNIVDVTHHRVFSALSIKSADLDLTIETRDGSHRDELMQAVSAAGFAARLLDI
ncbi:MAG: threonine ammonia-lyase [Spirochaetaceae bacterium]|nr:threonine ammonia-lyase [Spirochaetaceae bacterium]|tara:strand:+ start:4172 stop:5404 length:1233 start_codon:yes stop_codon:yes gene_type:complete